MTLPSSFKSSFRIHESLMANEESIPISVIQSFQKWIICFIVVQFDVNIGPDLKLMRPSVQFTEDDLSVICFSSLPERINVTGNTSLFHTFRFPSQHFSGEILYGYCLFSQFLQPGRQRGYIQESLVILTSQEIPCLYQKCLNRMVDHDMFTLWPLNEKIPLIDTAIHNVAAWDADNGKPFLGEVYVTMDMPEDVPLRELIHFKHASFIPNLIYYHQPFGSWSEIWKYVDTADIYMLYENILLAKPLTILASSPHVSSLIVTNLLYLLYPIPYCSNIAEYVTMQTTTLVEEDPSGRWLGVNGTSNPFLASHQESAHIGYKHKQNLVYYCKDVREQVPKNFNKSIKLIPADNKFVSNAHKANDFEIHSHFQSVTSQILAPLVAYVSQTESFSADHFLYSLSGGLFQKANRFLPFYKQFVRSKNFENVLSLIVAPGR